MATSLIQSITDVNSDNDANTWTAKILKPLDQVLRCHICFDYFSNCMMTKCSHNYCSICIRRYMAYKSQCPTCFQVSTEPELQNNRLIDEVLRVYKKIRESLKIPFDSLEKLCPDLPTTSKVDIGSTSKEPFKMDTSGSNPPTKAATETDEDRVSCPVCYITVSSDRINIHLDSCLTQSEDRSERKTLPKLVYHLLTDKQIKKKLKDHGLNTSGDRQSLIRRHKNFLILYNANCDALDPKPVSEVVLEIERQELEERVNASQRNTQINKRSEPSVIEKENEIYAKSHQSQFSLLIQDVQQRELSRREIKFEPGASHEDPVSSNITDDSGNKVGESILRIGETSNLETVTVKKEISDSPSSPYQDNITDSDDNSSRDSISSHTRNKTLEKDKVSSTSHLPFRIKKEVPSIMMKQTSPSLLDMPDEDVTADSPTSLDDFEISKKQTRSSHSKKNVRKLSIADGKGSQRKK